MISTRSLMVVAIQGEGNREKHKQIADDDRRRLIVAISQTPGRPIPPELMKESDPDPSVTLVLRDPTSLDQPCLDYTLRTWEEVEKFKNINGGEFWNKDKLQFISSKAEPPLNRHMPFGTITVTIG